MRNSLTFAQLVFLSVSCSCGPAVTLQAFSEKVKTMMRDAIEAIAIGGFIFAVAWLATLAQIAAA